ncbi:MAG: glycosyltransferase family 2 protein [Candidatus Amulumruptor caecigallinarius]|nr:glycosyltransferase family 2 protein [Candidatus Amulumruptor caecigallinarius]
MQISAIINTRNAEMHLQEVIDHLKEFDEILVCDMDSSDRTLQIARENGCRIIHHPPVGYVEPARNYAMKEARFDWVFFVDADELVTPPLADYLKLFLANPGNVSAVGIPRKNMFLDSWSKSTYPDYQIRVLNRKKCDWPVEIHSNPVVRGKTLKIPRERLDMALVHKSADLKDMLERMNRYTDKEVDRRDNGKVPGLFKMIFAPWWRFVKMYVLKGGFRLGVPGYIEAKNKSFYKLYTLAKLYEANRKNILKRNDIRQRQGSNVQ